MPESSSSPVNGIKRRSWANRLRDRLRSPKQPEDPLAWPEDDWMSPWSSSPGISDGHRAQTHARPNPSVDGSLFVAANFVYDYRQRYDFTPSPLGFSPGLRFGTTRPVHHQKLPQQRPSLSASNSFSHHPVQRLVSNRGTEIRSGEPNFVDRKRTSTADGGPSRVTTVKVGPSPSNPEPDVDHPETTVVVDRPGLSVSGQRVCIFTGHDSQPQMSEENNNATKVVLRIRGSEPNEQDSPGFRRNSLLRRSLSDRVPLNKQKPRLFQDTTRLQNLSRSRGSLHNLFANASDDDEANLNHTNGRPRSVRGPLVRPSEPPPPPPPATSQSPDVPTVPPRGIFRFSRTETPTLSPTTPEKINHVRPGRPLSAQIISWAAWAGLETSCDPKPDGPEHSKRDSPCERGRSSESESSGETADPGNNTLKRSDRKRRPISRLWSFSRQRQPESPTLGTETPKPELQDHIYEEIDENEDLNSPPTSLGFTRAGRGSLAGASRTEILRYIEDARKKNELNGDLPSPGVLSLTPGLPQIPSDDYEDEDMATMGALLLAMRHNAPNRNSNRSNASSQTSQDSVLSPSLQVTESCPRSRVGGDIERNDSGVGSETSGTARLRHRLRRSPKPQANNNLQQSTTATTAQSQPWCVDCDQPIEAETSNSTANQETEVNDALLCTRCVRRRTERREVLAELLETEVRYGRDLRVLQDELYKPLSVAGLVPLKHLDTVFLNVGELSSLSQQFCQRLRESVEIALEQGDDDLLTVDVGKLFLSSQTEELLNALRRYCVKSGEASLLLSSLEKERELLRIFLRASQLENPALRRMDLHAFLMVPVQRITKYPLLLGRLLRATATVDIEARETLRQAQAKVESFLAAINAEATELGTFTRPWRRSPVGTGPNPGSGRTYEDIMALRLRKMAIDAVGWADNTQITLEGMIKVTQPNDLLMTATRNRGKALRWTNVWAILLVLSNETKEEFRLNPAEMDLTRLIFPHNPAAREAALVLFKDVKTPRPGPSLYRDPLLLSQCTLTYEAEISSFFEIHHILSKESLIFQTVDSAQANQWIFNIKSLHLGLGRWKQRRNALSHVMMIN